MSQEKFENIINEAIKENLSLFGDDLDAKLSALTEIFIFTENLRHELCTSEEDAQGEGNSKISSVGKKAIDKRINRLRADIEVLGGNDLKRTSKEAVHEEYFGEEFEELNNDAELSWQDL